MSVQAKVFSNAFLATSLLIQAGTGTDLSLGRADHWPKYMTDRIPIHVEVESGETMEKPDMRSAVQHIENIRLVFEPTITELADLLGVTRQAVYKWLAGHATPEQKKMAMITELSRIADDFRKEEIFRPGLWVKAKYFDGRSLWDLLKTGENSMDHVATLLAEAKAVEHTYQRSGLALSKAPATNDWQAHVSIPGYLEQL